MELLEGKNTMERTLMAHAQSKRIPINGSMELLPLCNMNCDMCYVRLSREEMIAKGGRVRTAEEWLSLAQQMKDAGTLFMLLTGGEPLLHPEFKEIYLGMKKMGMILTVNTNATLLDESWADFFAKYKPRRINITLYGCDERSYENLCHYPGGYAKVVHAIELLKERGVDVRVGASVTKENADDIMKITEFCKKEDVAYNVDTYMMPATRERTKAFEQQSRALPEKAAQVNFETLVDRNEDKERFAEYIRSVLDTIDHFVPDPDADRHISCMAGRCSFTINWQGYMRQCVVSTSPQYSVFEEGFLSSWNKLAEEVSGIEGAMECAQCCRKILCRTCAVAGLFETGRHDGVPEYLCRYAEESERLYREWLKEYTGNE